MSVQNAGSEDGVREILKLPNLGEAELTACLTHANLRMKYELIGSTAYAEHLAQTNTADETATIDRATNLLAASEALRSRASGGVGTKGIMTSIVTSDGGQESYLTPDQAMKLAVTYANRAIHMLRIIGLYTTPIGQLLDVFIPNTDTA